MFILINKDTTDVISVSESKFFREKNGIYINYPEEMGYRIIVPSNLYEVVEVETLPEGFQPLLWQYDNAYGFKKKMMSEDHGSVEEVEQAYRDRLVQEVNGNA